MTDVIQIIWLNVCSLPSLPHWLLAGLTELSDNQQSIDMERSKSPTSGNTQTCTAKSTFCDWHCDAIVLKHELCQSMQPVDPWPFTRASSPDGNGSCLENQLMFSVVIWMYYILLVRKCNVVIEQFDWHSKLWALWGVLVFLCSYVVQQCMFSQTWEKTTLLLVYPKIFNIYSCFSSYGLSDTLLWGTWDGIKETDNSYSEKQRAKYEESKLTCLP